MGQTDSCRLQVQNKRFSGHCRLTQCAWDNFGPTWSVSNSPLLWHLYQTVPGTTGFPLLTFLFCFLKYFGWLRDISSDRRLRDRTFRVQIEFGHPSSTKDGAVERRPNTCKRSSVDPFACITFYIHLNMCDSRLRHVCYLYYVSFIMSLWIAI